MKQIIFSIFLVLVLQISAFAQTASEVPLTNPQVLAPPKREQGISPKPDQDETVAQAEPGPMTFGRLSEIVLVLDANAQVGERGMQLAIEDVPVTIVVDERANRMRAFSPFKTLDGVDGQILYRMMQANFDSALDARYAIAKGHVISVFIHPLGELQKDQFIESLGQVVNLVRTYGTAYTSGAMTFGGGDSNQLLRQLIDELLKKGEEI